MNNSSPHKLSYIPFTKMHALGNDFVVIDAIDQPFTLTPQQIHLMANRHQGIGFDQMLIITPPPQVNVDFGYRIFNADGQEVNQCGNGARCIAHYLKEIKLIKSPLLRLATRERCLELHISEKGVIAVDLGVPQWAACPDMDNFIVPYPCLGYVDIGNPHVIFSVNDTATVDVKTYGEALQEHPLFATTSGINVSFVQKLSKTSIRLRVYERGVGESFSCGSGACAAVVAATKPHRLDHPVTVECLQGHLQVNWPSTQSGARLSGPSTIAFRGTWTLTHS